MSNMILDLCLCTQNAQELQPLKSLRQYPQDVKKRRLKKLSQTTTTRLYRTQQFVGQTVEVLIEKESKKSKNIGVDEINKIQ